MLMYVIIYCEFLLEVHVKGAHTQDIPKNTNTAKNGPGCSIIWISVNVKSPLSANIG